jgi:hypothetical protein
MLTGWSARPHARKSSLARETERPSHGEGFCHALFRSPVTDQDIHLVRLPGEKDVRDSASPREALKARSMNGQ